MKKYFITATGTDIGKTFLCCEIIKYLKQQKYNVKAIKPVMTGFDINNYDEFADIDNVKILKSLNGIINRQNLINISPFSFIYPASPDIAARYESKAYVDYDLLLEYCRDFLNKEDNDYAFIEGIGGIMVPLNKDKLLLDLIKDLDIEIILISGNYLGTLNHSLASLALLKGCKIKSVIMNDISNDIVRLSQNIESLSNFFSGPIKKLYHHNHKDYDDSLSEIINGLI